MRKNIVQILSIVLISLLLSCDVGAFYSGKSTVNVEIQPFLRTDIPTSSSRAVLALSNQTVTLSAISLEGVEKSQNLVFDDKSGIYKGSLSVKTGSSCTFTVIAKDTAGTVYVKGQTSKKITSSTDSIEVTLVPVLSESEPVLENPFVNFSFAQMTVGAVRVVKYKPEWPTTITCRATLLEDAVFAVCDVDGNTLASGLSEWTMAPGASVFFLVAKTSESPRLLIGCDIPIVEFIISLDDPQKPVINNGEQIESISLQESLTITATSDLAYDEYTWILKNRVLEESTTSSITIKLSDHDDLLIVGENAITLAYRKGSRWYSAVIPFTVVQNEVKYEK